MNGYFRSYWTPAEVLQVRGVFGPHDGAEALVLFAPSSWEDFFENMTRDELVGELRRLRWKQDPERRAELINAAALMAEHGQEGPA